MNTFENTAINVSIAPAWETEQMRELIASIKRGSKRSLSRNRRLTSVQSITTAQRAQQGVAVGR